MDDVLPDPTFVRIGDTQVRYERHEGPSDGPAFVLVHGLGGSLDNWGDVATQLATRGPVVRLDLGGFGLTQVPPQNASLPGNLKLLQGFIAHTLGRPAIVAGNSMGGLLTAQLAARDSQMVAGAVLIDPAVPLVFRGYPHRDILRDFAMTSLPGLSRITAKRMAASTVRQEVERTIQVVTSRYDLVDPVLVDRHVDLSEWRLAQVVAARASFEEAGKSMITMLAHRKRFHSVVGRITSPVLLLHGDQDKLVNVRAARALAQRYPAWTYVEGAGIGHTPMFDFPDWTAGHILTWLDAHPGLGVRD